MGALDHVGFALVDKSFREREPLLVLSEKRGIGVGDADQLYI
jgi:hypothetical protein